MTTVNTQRYRTGVVKECRPLLKAGDVNNIGDIMGKEGSYARTYDVLSAGTAAFHDVFMGVLQQGATLGTETHDTPGLVYDGGEYEYPLNQAAAADIGVGALVGPMSSQVVACPVPITEAIGEVTKHCYAGETTITFRLFSVVLGGGIQPAQ